MNDFGRFQYCNGVPGLQDWTRSEGGQLWTQVEVTRDVTRSVMTKFTSLDDHITDRRRRLLSSPQPYLTVPTIFVPPTKIGAEGQRGLFDRLLALAGGSNPVGVLGWLD
jgi:hypothetical protein